MEKQTVILVGGGDSYTNREDFLQALRTKEMFDVPTDTPYRSWKAWVVAELEATHLFHVPVMPNRQNAHYDEWETWFERHLAAAPGNDLLLIGHSLGAMFLVKYLLRNGIDRNIKGLFLLAGVCGPYEDETGNDCQGFVSDPAEVARLSEVAEKIYLFHSKDDFIVPFEHALKFKAVLPEAELITFEDKNHFLIEEFPELVSKIKEIS